MGTFYTFVTELMDESLAAEVEVELKREAEVEGYFSYTRHEAFSRIYFTGTDKNLGGGYYDWPAVGFCRMSWIDDEGGSGETRHD